MTPSEVSSAESRQAVGYSVVDGTSSNVTRQCITPLGSEFIQKEGRRRRRTITLVTSNNDNVHNQKIHTTHVKFIGFRLPLVVVHAVGGLFEFLNEFHEPHSAVLVDHSLSGNPLVKQGTFPSGALQMCYRIRRAAEPIPNCHLYNNRAKSFDCL